MNGFYFIIQIDQKRSRIFVKGNEITIPLSSQFSSSNIQKKEGNKNYTKKKTISISHQLIFEGIICTTREFLISGLNTTSSKVDLYIPWNRPILGMIDALQSISNSLYQAGSKFIQLLANSMGYN